jgi:hypothetical protein
MSVAWTSAPREVGKKIGWSLGLVVLSNPEYVGLVAGPDRIVVIGPGKLSDLAAHDIELDLDALERGERKIARGGTGTLGSSSHPVQQWFSRPSKIVHGTVSSRQEADR